jgi:hypothetical protein
MSDTPGAAAPLMDTPADFGKGVEGEVARWQAEITQARRQFYNWAKSCRDIERRYRAHTQSSDINRPGFAILWANTETLKPAIYARPPVPVVARTFQDSDPVGRAASMILRRNIQHEVEEGKVHRKLKQVRDDYLLYGRGVMWATYRPKIGKVLQLTTESEEMGEDERVEGEEVVWDFVQRNDFLHSVSPNWDSVTWVGRAVRMTQDDGVARFGRKFREVPLSYKPERRYGADESDRSFDVFHRAEVFEVWDIKARKVLWLAEGYDQLLDKKDDFLNLHDFFPTPRPLYGTLTDSSLVPVPDYIEYGEQAEQLDELTKRIKWLTKAIKVVGGYDNATPEIAQLFSGDQENTLYPIRNWAGFAEKAGFKGSLDLVDTQSMAGTLATLIEARAQVKNDLYEITGISDVIRGAETSSGDKTATEIRTKGRYATLRLSDRQLAMAEYVRDVLRITGEIIAEHFDPETLALASNWQNSELAQDAPPTQPGAPPGFELFQQAFQLLRNDRLRGFRIDVEDKSTIAADEEEEKAARVQFLASVGDFIEKAISIPPNVAPVLAPLMGKMLMFGVRGFPVGLEMEQALEDGIGRLTKMLEQQAQQPPPPSPEMIKAQAAAQKSQTDAQIAQMQAQADMQVNQIRAQAMMAKSQSDQAIAQVQLQIEQIKAQMAGVQMQSTAAQAEAQNAQDATAHALAAQDADLEQQRFGLEVEDSDRAHAIELGRLALDARKLDIQQEANENKAGDE